MCVCVSSMMPTSLNDRNCHIKNQYAFKTIQNNREKTPRMVPSYWRRSQPLTNSEQRSKKEDERGRTGAVLDKRINTYGK